ncbi:hypothetical protein E2C01_053639 [Portunus trituberculatus]|uniref:Uncharacterized protein n=1 Tax=Portunus trituberculatus TaxID=210409 RepID=A0A5B7GQN5_PORTR|nr:hypothetical protein [Portunus trituberculatus]
MKTKPATFGPETVLKTGVAELVVQRPWGAARSGAAPHKKTQVYTCLSKRQVYGPLPPSRALTAPPAPPLWAQNKCCCS